MCVKVLSVSWPSFPFLVFFDVFIWILHVGSVEDTFKLAADQVITLSLRSEGSLIVKSLLQKIN